MAIFGEKNMNRNFNIKCMYIYVRVCPYVYMYVCHVAKNNQKQSAANRLRRL